MGDSWVGLDNYWREVSYGKVNLSGSQVVGWYTLPRPVSYYIKDASAPSALDYWSFNRLHEDCRGAAEADGVGISDFVGVDLKFNRFIASLGGGWLTWTTGFYESEGFAYFQEVAHEMAHAMGIGWHSGGYGPPTIYGTYDNLYDVTRSGGAGGGCPGPSGLEHPEYGCPMPHPIAWHKYLLGWIPESNTWTALPGTSSTVTLSPLSDGGPSSTYLWIKIPIAGSDTRLLTVEARAEQGYDQMIPHEGAIIHYVDATLNEKRAALIDQDQNGDLTDDGPQWLPGESYFNEELGIRVEVLSRTERGGYEIRVTNSSKSTQPSAHGVITNLELRRHLRAIVTLKSSTFASCARGAIVHLQRFHRGKWKDIRVAPPPHDETLTLKLSDRQGRYRAQTEGFALDGMNRCQASRSTVVRHRH